MKRIYIIIPFLILLFVIPAHGQFTNKQAGIRGGFRGGFFYQVTNQTGNAETGYLAMIGFRNKGIQFTGLKVIYELSLVEFRMFRMNPISIIII